MDRQYVPASSPLLVFSRGRDAVADEGSRMIWWVACPPAGRKVDSSFRLLQYLLSTVFASCQKYFNRRDNRSFGSEAVSQHCLTKKQVNQSLE